MSEYRAIGRSEDAAPLQAVVAGVDFTAGEALVQPSLNRVTVGGHVAQVEPKVMQVLLLMAARPGHVVGREAFLDTVWAGTVGDDYLLNRAVSELRRVFGDDPRSPRYIETIRKGGYRLVAPIAPARVAAVVAAERGNRAVQPAPPAVPADPDDLPAPPAEAGTIAEPRTALARSGRQDDGRGAARTRDRRRLGLMCAGATLLLAAALAVAWLAARAPGGTPEGGWDIQPLTSFVGRELEPALSPDGSRVAFVWDGGGRGFDVYVKTVGSEDALNLSRSAGAEHYPVWMPDGRSLLFARVDGEGLSVMRVSALGGAATRVLQHVSARAVRGLAVSPDGRTLAYAVREAAGAPYRIVLATLDGKTRRVLTSAAPASLGDLDPRFSPDGGFVVFVRALNEVTRDLYRVGVEGGAPMRLTFDNRKINGLAWSPDGRRLLFTSTRSGMYALWSADPDGGDLRQLPVGPEGVQQPATAAGVRAIAFEHWNHRSQLRQLDLASGAEIDAGPFFRSTRWDSSPAWSPDGRRLAFGSNRSGPHAIWVSGPDGREAAPIADFGGAFIDHPAWSPDGRLIAFDGSPDGTSAIYVVSPEGGAPRRITAGPGDSRRPSWSRDGAWLYFESNRDGQWQAYAQALSGGAPIRLVEGPAIRPRESADGRWLLHARPDAPGLWRAPRVDWTGAAASGSEPLQAELGAGDGGLWAPAERGIYFVRRAEGGAAWLSLFDPGDGRTVDLAALPGGFEGKDLQVSPDQGRLLYSQPLVHESDLRLAVVR